MVASNMADAHKTLSLLLDHFTGEAPAAPAQATATTENAHPGHPSLH